MNENTDFSTKTIHTTRERYELTLINPLSGNNEDPSVKGDHIPQWLNDATTHHSWQTEPHLKTKTDNLSDQCIQEVRFSLTKITTALQ